MTKQTDMFGATASDLPLFSQTPQNVQESMPIFEVSPKQVSLFCCKWCSDTGMMEIVIRGKRIKRPCNCSKEAST